MPEEEAFTVFVKIMYDLGVREMFKPGFEVLHLKLYQVGARSGGHAVRVWRHDHLCVHFVPRRVWCPVCVLFMPP